MLTKKQCTCRVAHLRGVWRLPARWPAQLYGISRLCVPPTVPRPKPKLKPHHPLTPHPAKKAPVPHPKPTHTRPRAPGPTARPAPRPQAVGASPFPLAAVPTATPAPVPSATPAQLPTVTPATRPPPPMQQSSGMPHASPSPPSPSPPAGASFASYLSVSCKNSTFAWPRGRLQTYYMRVGPNQRQACVVSSLLAHACAPAIR